MIYRIVKMRQDERDLVQVNEMVRKKEKKEIERMIVLYGRIFEENIKEGKDKSEEIKE